MSDLFSYASRGNDTTKGTTLMDYTYHPLSETYPLMGEDDLADLAASIKAIGQQESIWLLGAQILDGRNRYLACKIAKVKPRCEQYDGDKDQASLVAFIEAKNEHRRHLEKEWLLLKRGLSRKEKREAVVEVLKAEPEKSDRSIAEEIGVSPTTVGNIREKMEGSTVQNGQLISPNTEENHISDTKSPPPVIPKTERRIGADGKQRTAKKKKTPKAPVAMKDGKGNDVPDNLRDVFADRTLIETHNRLEEIEQSIDADGILSRVKARIKFLPFVLYEKLSEHLTQVEASLELARDTIKAGIPFAVCSKCGGKGTGCKQCRLAGYIPEWRHKEIEIEGV